MFKKRVQKKRDPISLLHEAQKSDDDEKSPETPTNVTTLFRKRDKKATMNRINKVSTSV